MKADRDTELVVSDVLADRGLEEHARQMRDLGWCGRDPQPTVWIWDNGESYSDWSIYFIRAPFSKEVFERVMLLRETNGFLVGRMDRYDFFGDQRAAGIFDYGAYTALEAVSNTDFGNETPVVWRELLEGIEKRVVNRREFIDGLRERRSAAGSTISAREINSAEMQLRQLEILRDHVKRRIEEWAA